MAAAVSILLPNRNHRHYLDERMGSILAQTLDDWELVVLDGCSSDGSWELFQEYAARDSRIHLHRASPRGIYASWNECVDLARGKFVYIATADDTMEPEQLARMVDALESQPACDIAHCKLRIIDDQGKPAQGIVPWDRYYGTLYFGELIDRPHVRLAPHDGLLYCAVRTLYTSVTQLLFRRTVFDRVGLFRTDLGSHADFEWGMRAGLIVNTCHVPSCLASWRVHSQQTTDLDGLHSAGFQRKLLRMIDMAFKTARRKDPRLRRINRNDLRYLYAKELLAMESRDPRARLSKWLARWRWHLARRRIFPEWQQPLRSPGETSVDRMEPIAYARALIRKYGLERNLILTNGASAKSAAPANTPSMAKATAITWPVSHKEKSQW